MDNTQKFDFSPDAKSDNDEQYPDTIWAGKAYPQYDVDLQRERMIISLKLYQASKEINLAEHLNDNKLCFKVIRKKDKDKYNNTHFIVLDQDPQALWPKQEKVSALNLAATELDEYGNFNFTLTAEDMVKFTYSFGQDDSVGRYMKLELVESPTDARVFRYTKKFGKEQIAFRTPHLVDAKPTVVSTTTDKAPETDEEFFDTL